MLSDPQYGAKAFSGLRAIEIHESIQEDLLAAKCNPKDCEARGQPERKSSGRSHCS